MRPIDADALQDAMKSVTNDPTCPLHIAAEIDQIIDAMPTVGLTAPPAAQSGNQDTTFMAEIIAQICDYAVDNGMQPNDTLSTVAENIKCLCEISDFNGWERRKQ